MCKDWKLLNKIFLQSYTSLTALSTFVSIVAILSNIEYLLRGHYDGIVLTVSVLFWMYSGFRLVSNGYIYEFIERKESKIIPNIDPSKSNSHNARSPQLEPNEANALQMGMKTNGYQSMKSLKMLKSVRMTKGGDNDQDGELCKANKQLSDELFGEGIDHSITNVTSKYRDDLV